MVLERLLSLLYAPDREVDVATPSDQWGSDPAIILMRLTAQGGHPTGYARAKEIVEKAAQPPVDTTQTSS